MKLNFEEPGANQESINVSLDDDIEAEQIKLEEGVKNLIANTKKISESPEKKELSPEVMTEVAKEAGELKERIYSMSERGFITPAFALRLIPLAAFYGLVILPQSMDAAIMNTPDAVIFASLAAAIWSVVSIGKEAILGWAGDYDFFEFDIEELKKDGVLKINYYEH